MTEHLLLELKERIKRARESLNEIDLISKDAMRLKDELADSLRKSAMLQAKSAYNEEGLRGFQKKWWTVVQKGPNEAILIVPKMYDMNFGWLEKEDVGYNHFRVNAVTNWISEIPEFVKADLGFAEPLDIQVIGSELTGRDREEALKRYGKSLKRVGERIFIDSKNYFDILAEIIRDGTMPFGSNPAPDHILTHNKPIDLYDFQRRAVDQLMDKSRSIILWPTGFGKTFAGLEAMNRVKPRYLIICGKSAKVQWERRIQEYLPHLTPADYDIMTFQGGVRHALKKKYSLVIIDEAHHIAADTFSDLLKIQCYLMLGLTATPYREDGVTPEMIIAVFGYPVGSDWNTLKNSKYWNPPTCHIWVVKTENDRFDKLAELLQEDKKTIIHCDGLDLGRSLAQKYRIPFVSGESKDRLDTILNSRVCIVSRIGTESLSDANIERGIEIDWQGKSKAQAMQRAGRIMHNKESTEGEHHIIMTPEQYRRDSSRFDAYVEKGFKIIRHKDGVLESDLNVVSAAGSRQPRRTRATPSGGSKKQQLGVVDPELEAYEKKHPILSLPGIQRTLQTLSRAERQIIVKSHQKPKESFSMDDYTTMLGYASRDSLRSVCHITNILKPGLLKKNDDGRYQADLSLMRLAR